jgi:hypothetical protein
MRLMNSKFNTQHNTKTAQIMKNIKYGSLLHTNEISQIILEKTYNKYYKTDRVGG